MQDRTAMVLHEVRAAAPTWRRQVLAPRRPTAPFLGMHRTTRAGVGDERADAREYQPGDDPRRIDWSASARTGAVQVRDTYADRGIRMTIVADCSASMRFGTDTITKAEFALAAAAGFALTANRQGDSVAAMVTDGDGFRWVPPGSGTAHVNVLLRHLGTAAGSGRSLPFGAALRRAIALAPSTALVVAISDFHDTDALAAVRRAAAAHRVLALVVHDRRELEMTPVGIVDIVDPETGETFTFDADSSEFRDRFAALAIGLHDQRIAALVAAGAEVVSLSCGPDWLHAVEQSLAGVLR